MAVKSFGRLLRTLRMGSGLSQADLAKRAGISQKSVSALECGSRKHPYPHTLQAIAEALDLSHEERATLVQAAAELTGTHVRPSTAPVVPRSDEPPNRDERAAAWEMYVELVTRITVADLPPDDGLLREALSSLYSLFGTIREILKRYGLSKLPSGATGDSPVVATGMETLNDVIRPVLAKWHPLLLDYEATRPTDVARLEHERAWLRNKELRRRLAETRATLAQIATRLASLAGMGCGSSEGRPG